MFHDVTETVVHENGEFFYVRVLQRHITASSAVDFVAEFYVFDFSHTISILLSANFSNAHRVVFLIFGHIFDV